MTFARRADRRTWLRRVGGVLVLALAAYAGYRRRAQLGQASDLLGDIHPEWLFVAIVLEMASMVVFARLQRWLLRAGGVRIGLGSMFEITLAGNALGTSLPGGAAWSATWAFGQLRRRGADRVLAGWVILVAGALASFALFVIVAAGAWVAGSHGPVAQLRWLAAALAAIPVVTGLLFLACRRSARVRRAVAASWRALERLPGMASVGRAVGNVVERLGTVQPGPLGWLEVFGLALVNWVDDAIVMAACILALGLDVPWRGLLVVYGLTQISASLPVTPGGIGVVEGSMSALLVAYGMPGSEAIASVLLYRIVSFWGLVPIGWAVWFGLEFAQRQGRRAHPHPWAEHYHAGDAEPVDLRQHQRVGPERLAVPSPCPGCPPGAEAVDVPADHDESHPAAASRG